MLNFLAVIETELGLRVEPVTADDRDEAVETAHRLGARFGDVLTVIVDEVENFRNEVELALPSFE